MITTIKTRYLSFCALALLAGFLNACSDDHYFRFAGLEKEGAGAVPSATATPEPLPSPEASPLPTPPPVERQVELFDAKSAVTTTIKVARPVDLLWVVDNSGSMRDDQEKLAAGFSSFAQKYFTEGRDIRLAITTTDAYLKSQISLKVLSTIPAAGVTTAESNAQLISEFTSLVKVGTSGSGQEASMSSIAKVLKSQEALGCKLPNAPVEGCLFRENAVHGIIILSDENDSSSFVGAPAGNSLTPEVTAYNVARGKSIIDEYFSSAGLSGQPLADPRYFVSAIVAPNLTASTCTSASCYASYTYHKLVEAVAGDPANSIGPLSRILDITNADYGTILDSIGNTIDKTVTVEVLASEFLLASLPVPETVQVDVILMDGSIQSLARSRFQVEGSLLRIDVTALPEASLIRQIRVSY